jgi:hypothetical protein
MQKISDWARFNVMLCASRALSAKNRQQSEMRHVPRPPLFTEPGWNLHTPAEVGVDDFQAKRSPGEQGYRTAS